MYTVHGFAHVWDVRGWRDRVLERVERMLAPRTDMLLFQSTEDLAQTCARGYRTRLRYLGNGVEDEWFTIPPRQAPSRPFRLLFVGRLIKEKGVLDLFDALAAVPDVHLTVAGAELLTDRDGVEKVIRDRASRDPLAGRVTFVGMVAKAQMQSLMASSDAVVLPSYREGVPRSLIEGFAAGRPAVATAVRGCRELVEDGVTGFLVPPGRPDRLAHALRAMSNLPDRRYREMSAAARALAESTYRESAVFGRLVDAYGELLGERSESATLRTGVVVDDLTGRELDLRTPAQEEHPGCAVVGVPARHHPVQEPQPEEERPHDAAGILRSSQASGEVVDAPEQLGPRPGDRSGIDLLEPSEQIPVAAGGEAGEVVGAGMNVLEEGRLGVDEAVVAQHAVDLGHHLTGIEDVLEDGLSDDGIDAPVGERQGMPVGHDDREIARVEIHSDELDIGSGSVEGVDPVTKGAPADD
ncbi:hypothetical protein F4554_003513 [Actinopolymorpha rutila]|uniref:Glycosyl transferase family 1 domain-containing protein n=1 Tax=Actinopolymorpha rutila TaxID=446787 RepID=A0A852ZFE3_9ACTN|nr:hypothetical protein [Actinopolymorpha rutila]